jgi:hypothetical protein
VDLLLVRATSSVHSSCEVLFMSKHQRGRVQHAFVILREINRYRELKQMRIRVAGRALAEVTR